MWNFRFVKGVELHYFHGISFQKSFPESLTMAACLLLQDFQGQELRLLCRKSTSIIGQNGCDNTPVLLCLLAQSCLTLCDPMNCSPPGSSVHGILQARILENTKIKTCNKNGVSEHSLLTSPLMPLKILFPSLGLFFP